MSNSYMADISGLVSLSPQAAKNSTSRANNTELNMEDFLTLMIVQLQNQTIDDTADTSEMLNQMVQMQMITALTNMTDASLMSYAGSLVGKEVTIGIINGNKLEERVITVTGTGVANGEQVIFGNDGNTYSLSQIMAVGRLPEIQQPEEPETPDSGTDKPSDSTDRPVDSVDQPGEDTPDTDKGDVVDPTQAAEGT